MALVRSSTSLSASLFFDGTIISPRLAFYVVDTELKREYLFYW